jgi:3'-phosphoadenosine 5'-phosphosulfate (PAPS) 3'-phosphatase
VTSARSDARIAADLAGQAGDLLLMLRQASGLTGKELGKRGDAASNSMLLRELAEVRPGDAVLSEESADSPERLSAKRVWIIDPLDGTREYGMPGRDDWAVHVALWEAGAGITAAAVAQPALNTVYVSDQVRVKHRPRPRPRFLVSDSRPPEWAAPVAQALGAQLVPMGSAGAKAMAVVRGEADIYLHTGGQYEWDNCAPAAVAQACGLHVSRADGAPLRYNCENPYLPDLLICRPELADEVLTHFRALAG